MATADTVDMEDSHMPPFAKKIPVSIERGEGVYVWDEEGNRYLDFTSGWGVTCIGHAHPALQKAISEQSGKILQNPNSGLTYSPARARLLALLTKVLPSNLSHVFFTNSGAEANDAAIKLARKVTGRSDVVSTHGSFHGRTISTASATGQLKHREKFSPLMPGYRFAQYDDVRSLRQMLDEDVAAVILEPIQGEGGVRIPSDGYLLEVAKLCKQNGSLLIVDEIQTGFCRTGPMFAIESTNIEVAFMTMAKGIGGGFPLGAFAMSRDVAARLESGDHGGTYCGNPLACAASFAVINYLLENDISTHVSEMGRLAIERMSMWKSEYSQLVKDLRGVGLLMLIEFYDEATAAEISAECLTNHLFVRQTQGTGIRLFPALTIKHEELLEGIATIERSIASVSRRKALGQN